LSRRKFLWPVSGNISSGFGKRSRNVHDGVDIIAPAGAEVRAADLGITIYAGNELRGYGNAVVLDHGDGVRTLYGHLATIRVKSADAVPAGAVIGTVGRTGNATGYHLHFELWVDGEAVDPMAYVAP
jgi:murein DD-endopeptidase MepM/ murein hydrolase activator NlpD